MKVLDGLIEKDKGEEARGNQMMNVRVR